MKKLSMRARILGTSFLALGTLALPALAFGASLLDTLALFNTFLNAAIGLLITLAIVAFFYGLVRYLFTEGTEGKAAGLKVMLMGVITIFVMVSIWGIIRLLQSTFQVTSTQPVIPQGIQINTQ
jgi:Type IV secretion system pilin